MGRKPLGVTPMDSCEDLKNKMRDLVKRSLSASMEGATDHG